MVAVYFMISSCNTCILLTAVVLSNSLPIYLCRFVRRFSLLQSAGNRLA